MSAKERVERVLRNNAVKPSGGCLPVLVGLALVGLLWWPPGVVQAAHWSRGNGASAVQPETGVSPQANVSAGATIPVTAQPGLAPEPVAGSGLYFVNLTGSATETVYHYELRSCGPPAISHVELALCTPRLLGVQIDPATGTAIEVRPGAVKIETPTMQDDEIRHIYVTMQGAGWSAVPTAYTLKSGTMLLNGSTYGPQCGPNAVALSGLGAQSSGGALRYYALLGLLLLGGISALVVARRRLPPN